MEPPLTIAYRITITIAALDSDRDGLSNWHEWQAGTDPTNALSTLRLLPPLRVGEDVVIAWLSIQGRIYRVERAARLGSPVFELLTTRLATNTITAYTDT